MNTLLEKEPVGTLNAPPLRESQREPMRGEQPDGPTSCPCAQTNVCSLRSGNRVFVLRAAMASAIWNARNQVRPSSHNVRAARGMPTLMPAVLADSHVAGTGRRHGRQPARVTPPFRCQSRAENGFAVTRRASRLTACSSPRPGRATGRHKPTLSGWDEALRASRTMLASSPRFARGCVEAAAADGGPPPGADHHHRLPPRAPAEAA